MLICQIEEDYMSNMICAFWYATKIIESISWLKYYVFWCINSNFPFRKKTHNLLELNRTLNVLLTVWGMKICQPQYWHFSSQVVRYFHLEQHRAGKEHCLIKKPAKIIIVHALIHVDSRFSCEQGIQIFHTQR